MTEGPCAASRDAWIAFFCQMSAGDVIRKAEWMPLKDTIYRCGQYGCVPLLGPWGGVSYAPLLVLRQLAIEQFIPAIGNLADTDFDYDEKILAEKIKNALKAWKHIQKIKGGRNPGTATPDYLVWLGEKKKIEPSKKRKCEAIEPEQSQDIEIQQEDASFQNVNSELQQELDQWKERALGAEKVITQLRK